MLKLDSNINNLKKIGENSMKQTTKNILEYCGYRAPKLWSGWI